MLASIVIHSCVRANVAQDHLPFGVPGTLDISLRPRCSGESCVLTQQCPLQYEKTSRRVEDAFFSFELPIGFHTLTLCKSLCAVSNLCTAHNLPPWGEPCYHWNSSAGSEEGDTPAVAEKVIETPGCFNISYDYDVSALFAAIPPKLTTPWRCFDECESDPLCTHVAYDALDNLCTLGHDTVEPDALMAGIGNGLLAIKSDPECRCPEPTTTELTTTRATTGTVASGITSPFVFNGTVMAGDRLLCPPSSPIVCPLYRECTGGNCQQWEAIATYSNDANETVYHTPATRCERDTKSCQMATSAAALTPIPPPAPVPAASPPSPPYVGPYADDSTMLSETDDNVVEIVITSVIGGCGLILIAAGFYYRRQLVERIA